MKRYTQLIACLTLAWNILPVVAVAQEEDRKIGDSGIGFALSTNGQSIFYTRGTNPFLRHHRYITVGFHQEEHGISVPYYDYFTNTYQTNRSQSYYLELGGGWHRLWFQDKLAAGFFPHTTVEFGVSGNVAEFGKFRNYFRDTSLRWSPYGQVAFGASIHTKTVFYRIELGYLSTLPLPVKNTFEPYKGIFFKVVAASGQKPR